MQSDFHHGMQWHPRGAALLDFSTTTLDEKQQHNYKQHAGDDPNDYDVVHVKPPFFLFQYGVKRLRHDNRGWSEDHHEKRWEDKKHKWEDKLYGSFGRLLLDLLAAFDPQGIGVDAQGFGYAGS